VGPPQLLQQQANPCPCPLQHVLLPHQHPCGTCPACACLPSCPPPSPLCALCPQGETPAHQLGTRGFPEGREGSDLPLFLVQKLNLQPLGCQRPGLAGAPWPQHWGSALAAACNRPLCHPARVVRGAGSPKTSLGLDPALGSSTHCLHLRASPGESNLSCLPTSATGLYWVPGVFSSIAASSQATAGPRASGLSQKIPGQQNLQPAGHQGSPGITFTVTVSIRSLPIFSTPHQ